MNFIQRTLARIYPERWAGDYFYTYGSLSSVFWGGDADTYLAQFTEIPEVNSVLSKKSRMFSNMRFETVDLEGESIEISEPIVDLMQGAVNFYQSHKEFLKQSNLLYSILGNELLYFLRPVGMDENIKAVFTIPFSIIEIKIRNKEPYFFQEKTPEGIEYYYFWNNERRKLEALDLVHIAENNVLIDEDSYLTGQSKLGALQGPIKNIRAAYEARNVLIENRGPLGAWVNRSRDHGGGTIPMKSGEKKTLQREFKKYGLTKNQWQVIFTNQNLQWVPMTLNVGQLKLYEEVLENFVKICDTFGMAYESFGAVKGVTFANRLQAEKETYQDTIIPEANNWITALNRGLKNEERGWKFIVSYDHLPIMQDDITERAGGLKDYVDILETARERGIINEKEYKDQMIDLGILNNE